MMFIKKIKKGLKKKKITQYINNIKKYLINKKSIIIISIPYMLLHIFMVIMTLYVRYNFHNIFVPLLFSASWAILFIGAAINLKGRLGKIFYLLITSIFIILFITNGVYFSIMNTFFDFNLLESASEGAPYILDALKNCNIFVYLAILVVLVFSIYAFVNFPKAKKTNYNNLIKVFLVFFILHLITPFFLGSANKELTWSNWRNARNIYNSFNDNNKSMKVSGFFEYEIRNFYLTYLKTKEQENEEDLEFLNLAFQEELHKKNNYTGIFKDKNLIIVQLEGMDNWIVDKDTTPTIYKMMREGINFSNHFSFYNGGGSTFNSEFVINTGFVTPYSYTKNAYSFNRNYFPFSLANIFKNMDYSVNAFHMNSGEYYSRTINYLNWGYDNYYGLKDEKTYDDASYQLDRELILNEHFNELEFPSEGKFVNYIITYSGHLPFTNTKGVCKMLYDEDNLESDNDEFIQMSEEECVKRQNKETDYMMSLLLKELEDKKLIDDTVIVTVTDHYLYTLEDQSILEKYKETKNNLINKTPFFIWSKGLKSKTVKEVTSQMDILPTILNLFGVTYSDNTYIGSDSLASSYRGLVFFNDYSWYDGNVYVDGGIVINGKKISQENLENKNYRVNYLTRKNDLALKYNYFNKVR